MQWEQETSHRAHTLQRHNKFHHYDELILISLFTKLIYKGEMYGHFMEDNATAQTAAFSVSILDKVSTEQLITHRL